MFCQKCGTQYEGGVCPNCGNSANSSQQVQSTPVININTQQTGGVRCPKCGSTNLQAVSDVQGKGVKLWKLCLCGLFGLCGAGKTKTEHYWVCGNCGNRFKL